MPFYPTTDPDDWEFYTSNPFHQKNRCDSFLRIHPTDDGFLLVTFRGRIHDSGGVYIGGEDLVELHKKIGRLIENQQLKKT